MSHTQEPWEVRDTYKIWPPPARDSGCATPVAELIHDWRGEEDAARIVACVNACAGLPDPEKNIRELVAALSFAVLKLTENGLVPIDQGIIDAVKPFCLNPSEEEHGPQKTVKQA